MASSQADECRAVGDDVAKQAMTCPNCREHVKEIRYPLYWQLICRCKVEVGCDLVRIRERGT